MKSEIRGIGLQSYCEGNFCDISETEIQARPQGGRGWENFLIVVGKKSTGVMLFTFQII